MSWKFVFNTDHKSWTERGAALAARGAGYQFFVWNSKIYFLSEDNKQHETELTRKDLF